VTRTGETSFERFGRLLAALPVVVAGAAPVACGSSASTSPADAGSHPTVDAASVLDAAREASDDDGALPVDAAPLPPVDATALVPPRVLDFEGGVLVTPKLVAVTFLGDPYAPELGAFTQAIGASQYWKAVTSEYGVGPAAAGTVLVTEDAPPSVDTYAGDSESWLATRFDGTHPEWGTFDPSAVYVVFYPSTTTAVENVDGCGGAYHDSIVVSVASPIDGGSPTSALLVYAIVFRCATSPDVGRPTGLDLTTFMASHEMTEAATDPYGTAFSQTDQTHVAWSYFFGSEVADMCAFHAGAAITPSDVGHAVQRSWSNAAASALADPCVPSGASPYFVAAPTSLQPFVLAADGGPVPTQGFRVPTGQSMTVDVGFYGAAAGPWTVTPFTYAMEHGDAEPYLRFSPATLTGAAGDVLPLTVTRIADDEDGTGGDAVKLVSSLGGATTEWYFAVGN
jgi:hypothetical protein